MKKSKKNNKLTSAKSKRPIDYYLKGTGIGEICSIKFEQGEMAVKTISENEKE